MAGSSGLIDDVTEQNRATLVNPTIRELSFAFQATLRRDHHWYPRQSL